jgi:hypothetical protein
LIFFIDINLCGIGNGVDDRPVQAAAALCGLRTEKPPRLHKVGRTIDALDADEGSGPKAEDRHRAIIANDDAGVGDLGRPHHLEFELALITPEPGRRAEIAVLTHDDASDVSAVLHSVRDRFQSHLTAIAGAMEARAVPDREDVRVGGSQAGIDPDAVCNREASFGGEFVIGPYAD